MTREATKKERELILKLLVKQAYELESRSPLKHMIDPAPGTDDYAIERYESERGASIYLTPISEGYHVTTIQLSKEGEFEEVDVNRYELIDNSTVLVNLNYFDQYVEINGEIPPREEYKVYTTV